jgi:bacteriorhodopsin
MSFFTSGLFWFIEGIIACLIVIGFKIWMEDRKVPMNWWKWLLFCLWILWFGFTIAFVFTSAGENEMDAAVKGGILFGIITIIAGVGLWRIIHIGVKKLPETVKPIDEES